MSNKSTGLMRTKVSAISGELPSGISITSPFYSQNLGIGHAAGIADQGLSALREQLVALQNPTSPASLSTSVVANSDESKTIENRLFDATANVKVLTSQIAMHLDREWRERLFKQLDSLHDPEEWDPEDKPIQQVSFATFLKAICQIRPMVRPGLGLSHDGLLVAAWTSGKNRLTIEFMRNDRVRWIVSRYPDGEFEQFAGQTLVSRLLDSLKPYSPEEWLFKC